MRHHLTPYPASQPPPFTGVCVDTALRATWLTLDWRLTGSSHTLLLPPPGTDPVRRDGLWRTTCFELFLRPGAGGAYYEFNLSPSGDWAAYRFDAYREEMANADVEAPEIQRSDDKGRFGLTARISLSGLPLTPSARIGLSAILETMDGAKSWWALAHHGDKPDFHRAEGFIARLPYGSRP